MTNFSINSSGTLSPQEVEALLKAIEHRRSVGVARLKPDAVPEDLIKIILSAANWAPSHGETEPWRFSVFTGEGRHKLGEAFANAYKIQAEKDGDFSEKIFQSQLERGEAAPVWISIGMTPGEKSYGEIEECIAVGCAVQNLHLAASALGLAGMWQSNSVMTSSTVAEFLGLTPPSKLLGFFPLGWPGIDWPSEKRRPVEEKVTWTK